MKYLVAVLLALVALTGCGPTEPTLVTSAPTTPPAPTATQAPPIAAAAEPVVEPASASETNAVKKAQSYLDFSAFSRKGLINQLKFDGFSTGDATYGADHVSADWMAQAAKKADSYLRFSAFSSSGLAKQLKFDGFTAEEAAFGVKSVGL